MTGALTYLTVRSIRNSFVLRLRRLRQPRYLFVALALVFYFGSTILSRSQSGGLRVPIGYESLARLAAASVVFVILAASWILPATAALRFTLPEISLLFPAPISRRRLLQYKIARLFLAAFGGALFIAVFVGPTRPAAAAVFALKTWLVMSVLGLYEAGVSLYRINARASGGLSMRFRLPVVAAGLALMALAAWILAVFAFPGATRVWLRVFPLVALLLFALVVWILSSDAAFEEDAALNADKVRDAVLRLQRGQPRLSARRGTPYRLAPTGPVELAILWKNWLLFGRASRTWIIGVVAVLVVFIGTGLFAGGKGGPEWEIAPFFLLVVAGIIVLMGPMMVRTDLRRDLAHLVVIKTWPVRGAAIVRGEVLAPAIALSLGAIAAIVPGGLLVDGRLVSDLGTGANRAAFIGAATAAAAATIFAQLIIQNGIAVTFPAWVRLRTGGAGAGVEGMGQMLVVMYGGFFVLLLATLVPVAAAALVMLLGGGLFLPALVFAALLLVECLAATEIIGRVLERTDLQDVR